MISANDTSDSTNPIVKLKQHAPGNAFVLQLANLQQIATAITLSDLDGRVLHRNQINAANGRLYKFTMKAFADGTYVLKIDWNDQSSEWLIYKSGSELKFQLNSKKQDSGAWFLQEAT